MNACSMVELLKKPDKLKCGGHMKFYLSSFKIGMKGIWLNRNRVHIENNIKADTIYNLSM